MRRRLNVENVMNLRDLGGFETKEGGVTRYKEFLRSDALYGLSEQAIEYLFAYGVRTVIDLRDQEEIELAPSSFAGSSTIRYHNIPLSGDMKFDPESAKNIELNYVNMAEDSSAFPDIFRTIAANTEGIVIFHCTAGKDRTGIIAALLFMLVDVPWNDIVCDYQISYTNVKPLVEQYLKYFPDIPIHIFKSEPELMEAFLRFVDEKGGVWEYLTEKGVAPEDLSKIKTKLVKN